MNWIQGRGSILRLVGLLGLLGLLAGCGAAASSSSKKSSSTSTVSSGCKLGYVTRQVNAHLGIPGWTPPGPPLNPAKAKGALIYTIEESNSNAFDVNIVKGINQAAALVGIKTVNYPNQGLPSQWIQGIDQAVAAHAKVIIFTGGTLGPNDFKSTAAYATQHGVKLITVVATDLTQHAEQYVSARVAQPYTTAAQLDADWIIEQTKCHAHVLLMTTTGLLAGNVNTVAAQEWFRRYCGSGCSVKVVNVPLTSWSTQIQPDVTSAIEADHSLNYVFPLYDAMVQYVIPGIKLAGATGRVHVASFNGTPGILQDMETGSTLTMDVGENEANLGYAAIDQAMRVLGCGPVITSGNEHIPLVLFDKANVSRTGTPPVIGQGYGTAWKEGYLKLWGLG